MNTFFNPLRRALASHLLVGMLAVSSLVAAPAAAGEAQYASNDCYAIGMQIASQSGGTLARATPETRGGQRVCVIVILKPARDGRRPEREEVVVPAG